MAQTTIVNKFGKLTGWNSVTYNWFGRDVEGILGLSYDDNVKWSNEYGAGRMPIGQSEGNYEPKAEVELYEEEIQAMRDVLPEGLRLQDVSTPIIVNYDLRNRIVKDIIHDARVLNIGKALKQGDGKMVHKCTLLVSHITWHKI